MTDLQKRLFEDLCLLRDILDKNNIVYYLAYGTLLGAVRHKGFIPWDDDVDIYINVEDLPRLRKVFENESGRLTLHDYTTQPDYPYSIPKIVDKKTVLKEKAFKHLNYCCGLYIDVFPLIGIPDNFIMKSYLEKMRYFYYGLIKYYNIEQGRFPAIHHAIKKYINLNGAQKGLDKNLLSVSRSGAMVTDPLAFEARLQYPKEYFSNTTDMLFEGELFKIPANYEEYLRKTYGDYMQLPPEDKRFPTHDFFFKILE